MHVMLQEFYDYIYVRKAFMLMNYGTLVGTRNLLCFIPQFTEVHKGRKIITTHFSYQGMEIPDAVQKMIRESRNPKELEMQLKEVKETIPETVIYDLNKIGRFKVNGSFFGSGIMVNPKDTKFGYVPFVQRLGKRKKEIKSFYETHPKIK